MRRCLLLLPPRLLRLALLWGLQAAACRGFQAPATRRGTGAAPGRARSVGGTAATTSSSSADAAAPRAATLTADTTWVLRLLLRGLQTTRGSTVEEELVTLRLKFLEDAGYEPPQGRLAWVREDGGEDEDAAGRRWRFSNTYWKLSEDPNERRDGLWVWGLFREPLYPYLLLELATEAVPLLPTSAGATTTDGGDGGDGTGGDSIPPLRLYAQLNHSRDPDRGAVLGGTRPLYARTRETVRADIFGQAATADLYNDVEVGTIRLEPLLGA